MVKNVLIVDNDKGFATILNEALNNHPDFSARTVSTSTRALQFVVENPVDLVIIDLGLTDIPAVKLINAMREAKSDIALMIIPLIGQDAPPAVVNLGVQGILPKPFFVGDLPKLVGQAVGLNLESEVPDLPPQKPAQPRRTRPRLKPADTSRPRRRPAPPPERRRPATETPSPSTGAPVRRTKSVSLPALPSWKLEQLHKNQADIVVQLKALNSEIRAEVILLTVGTELIAKAGIMPDDRAQELALLVAESAEAASQAAAFLGERDARFEQSLHEGNQYRLYTYSLGQGVVLSLALGTNTPLGILRHQTKQIGQNLMKYIR